MPHFKFFLFLEKGMPDVICNDSNANCYHKEEQVKLLLTDETECNSAYEHYRDTCSIELSTQIYTSFDRGKNFSYIHLKILCKSKLLNAGSSNNPYLILGCYLFCLFLCCCCFFRGEG